MQIGTPTLDRAEADAGAALAGAPRQEPGAAPAGPRRQGQGPGADGTLLAVVPIPGTGTSLAIVGYPVATPGSAEVVVAAGSVPWDAAPVPADVRARPGGDRPGLVLDHDQRRVWADGSEVELTFQEFELLAFLTAHPATVFSRADLAREAWRRDFDADSRTVDVHVSRLRHKLGASYGRWLVTEYRVGYQFRPSA